MNRHEAIFVFRKYHNDDWSVSKLGRHLGRAHTTIERILTGDAFPDVTAELADQFPAYHRDGPAFSDADFAEIFAAFHDDRDGLSEIGRRYGVAYLTIRRILDGEYYKDRTEQLRAKYPPYKARVTSFTDDELGDIFAGYHDRHESLEDLAARFGKARHTIRDLLIGRKGAGQTAKLRARYGSEIRPSGREGWRPNAQPATVDS